MSANLLTERRRHEARIDFIVAVAKVAGVACDDVALTLADTKHLELYSVELRNGGKDVVTVAAEVALTVENALARLEIIVDALARGRIKALRAEEQRLDTKYLTARADQTLAWRAEGAATEHLLAFDPLSQNPVVRAAVVREQRAKAAVKAADLKADRTQQAQRRAFEAWAAAQGALDDAWDVRNSALRGSAAGCGCAPVTPTESR